LELETETLVGTEITCHHSFELRGNWLTLACLATWRVPLVVDALDQDITLSPCGLSQVIFLWDTVTVHGI
jgi:hypothetical protein